MALKSTIALATRGRIIPSNTKRVLALASLGWILVTTTPIPPPTPPDHGGQFVGGGRPHTQENYDEHSIKEWEFRKRIKRDDDELLTIIKIWTEQNG